MITIRALKRDELGLAHKDVGKTKVNAIFLHTENIWMFYAIYQTNYFRLVHITVIDPIFFSPLFEQIAKFYKK